MDCEKAKLWIVGTCLLIFVGCMVYVFGYLANAF